MRFLLECVSCYGTATPDPSREDSSQSAPEDSRFCSSLTISAEEFVSAPRGALRRRSRSLSRLGPGDWKPSLHAICEDNVVPQAKPKAKTPDQMDRAASARSSGRRCASSSPRVRSHGHTDSYGRDPLPMIVPAFSPTPFMF